MDKITVYVSIEDGVTHHLLITGHRADVLDLLRVYYELTFEQVSELLELGRCTDNQTDLFFHL